jgi:trehalose 6-phosphate phosphatase
MALSILSAGGRRAIEDAAIGNVTLVFDFDGTLAPIVTEPSLAEMRPATTRLLHRVARLYPCAVLSGRGRMDIVRRLKGVPLDCVVGNHGLEWGVTSLHEGGEIQACRRALERVLQPAWGAWIEDKALSLTVHLRNARAPRNAAAAVERVVAAMNGRVRLLRGADSMNLLPAGTDKGHAVKVIRSLFGCTSAIYVGDDETDEDVFELPEPPWSLIGIRIGPGRTRARWRLPVQKSIDDLLRFLERLRSSRLSRARR